MSERKKVVNLDTYDRSGNRVVIYEDEFSAGAGTLLEVNSGSTAWWTWVRPDGSEFTADDDGVPIEMLEMTTSPREGESK